MGSGDGDVEQHRHRCEVRQVLAWTVERGGDWVHGWLYGRTDSGGRRIKGVADVRGQAAAGRLRDDAREQWRRGNRGEPGDWR
jgi:hypothetical protein